MPITNEVLDQILKDYEKPEDLLSESGLLQQLTKALVERALNGELTHHLGYEKHDPAGYNSGNSRNGYPSAFQQKSPSFLTRTFTPTTALSSTRKTNNESPQLIILTSRGSPPFSRPNIRLSFFDTAKINQHTRTNLKLT